MDKENYSYLYNPHDVIIYLGITRVETILSTYNTYEYARFGLALLYSNNELTIIISNCYRSTSIMIISN